MNTEQVNASRLRRQWGTVIVQAVQEPLLVTRARYVSAAEFPAFLISGELWRKLRRGRKHDEQVQEYKSKAASDDINGILDRAELEQVHTLVRRDDGLEVVFVPTGWFEQRAK